MGENSADERIAMFLAELVAVAARRYGIDVNVKISELNDRHVVHIVIANTQKMESGGTHDENE